MDNSVTLFASACVEAPANRTVVAFDVVAAPAPAPAPAPDTKPEPYQQQQQRVCPMQGERDRQARMQQLQQ